MGLSEIVIAGIGMSCSMILYFLSAILDATWWNFLVLIPLFMLAIPFLFCFADAESFADNDGWLNSGQFFSGFLSVSLFAIPVLNYHLGAIVARQFWLAIGGNLCALFGFVGYFAWQHYKSDSLGGFF